MRVNETYSLIHEYQSKIFMSIIDKVNKAYLFIITCLVMNDWFTFVAFADAASTEPRLTKMFDTKAFRGSWTVLNSLNKIGWFLNTIISVFCFMGLFYILYQKIITVLYFSARPLWDNVHEVKESNKEGPMGLSSYFKGVVNSSTGSGIDSFVNLLYIFAPDVKRHSEYNPGNRANNLKEEDHIGTWFVKTFPSTVLAGFLLAMGFNGTLMKTYGVAIDGLGAFAENVVSINAESYVNKMLASGSNHNFTIGASGNPADKVRQDIAEDIYRLAIGKMEVLDTDTRLSVGAKVEKYVLSNITNAEIASRANGGNDIPDRDWRYVKHEVIASSTDNINNGLVVSPSDLGLANTNKPIYFHIFLTKKGSSDNTNYFEVVPDNK